MQKTDYILQKRALAELSKPDKNAETLRKILRDYSKFGNDENDYLRGIMLAVRANLG